MKMKICAGALLLALGFAPLIIPADAQTVARRSQATDSTYSSEEIIADGHQFFGNTTRGLAEAVE